MIIIDIHADLPGDCSDYEVIVEATKAIKTLPGLAVEIGLRKGGGCRYIIDTLQETNQNRTLVAIDPYGNIDYITDARLVNDPKIQAQGPGIVTTKMDYTNEMRNECIMNMMLYCNVKNINFIFFNMEDTEFFKRFADGVPVYQEVKRIETQYALVHFDGPHDVEPVMREVEFFSPRAPIEAVFIFDDIKFYNHAVIDKWLLDHGWLNRLTTNNKWSYTKLYHK